MTYEQLIAKISPAYGFGHEITQYAADPEGNHGDPLAAFIAAELRETFEPDKSDAEQVLVACLLVETAERDLRGIARALAEWSDELQGLPEEVRRGKCAECQTPYPVDLPACPKCGTVERTLCQAQGCDEIECSDLATGVFRERGHTFDGCDDHRDHPYPREAAK